MFSINLQRSVGALAVTVGLLAAAAPANAGTPGGVGGHDPHDATVKAPTSAGPAGLKTPFGGDDALRSDSNEVAVEGITLAHERWLAPVDDMDLSIRGDAGR